MITRKDNAKNFAFFKNITKGQYNLLRNHGGDPNVDDETICFVSDTGKIYTQGYEFGGQSDNTYTAGDYITISDNTIDVNYNNLKSRLNNDGFGQGSTYTGSSSIDINNNSISVNTNWLDNYIGNIGTGTITLATDSKIGGFKTGYPETTSKTYRVQLDSEGRAFVYVPWTGSQVNPLDPENPDPEQNPSSNPSVVKLTESEFLELQNSGQLTANTLYIIIDENDNILYMYLNGNIIHVIRPDENDQSEVVKVSKTQWDTMTNEEKRSKTYIITDGQGVTVIAIGIDGVYTRIPVPANGTVERISQDEYNRKLNADPSEINEGTLYLIVDGGNNLIAMYLGTTALTFDGSDPNVIRSILTSMFSEKITFDGNTVDSINYSIIDVDNPGDFYAKTGILSYVTNTIREAGFISETDYENSFAEMFAHNIDKNDQIVKKASVIASINDSNESNVKINADKINVDGVFEQKTINGVSASQIISDGSQISQRVLTIEDGYVKVSNVDQSDDMIQLLATYTDLNNVAKNAYINLHVDENTSKIYFVADDVIIDGNTIARSIAATDLTLSGKVIATDAELSGAVVSNSEIVGSQLFGGSLDIYNNGSPGNKVYIGTGEYDNAHYGIIYSLFEGEYPLYVGSGVQNDVNIINGFDINGSGRLAHGNIQWDAEGNLIVKNISFSGNAPVITNNGSTVSVSQRYNITPTIIAQQNDIITLPNSPEGTVFNILVISTAHHDSGNSVQIKCVDGNDINVYYEGAWHNYAENDTFCQQVGMYHFVKKGNIWYSIFPY